MSQTDSAPVAARREGYAKSLHTRSRILAAAEAEATERGFHKTSVARIAARANVAVGSVNYHFGSHAELMRAMSQKLMTDLFRRLAAADADNGGDFFDHHRADLLAYVQYVMANPAHVRLTDEIKLLEPELYADGIANWVKILGERLRAGMADGSVRPMDDDELKAQAHFLLGARHFLEQMMRTSPPESDTAVVDAYIALVRNGLARRAASGGRSKRPGG